MEDPLFSRGVRPRSISFYNVSPGALANGLTCPSHGEMVFIAFSSHKGMVADDIISCPIRRRLSNSPWYYSFVSGTANIKTLYRRMSYGWSHKQTLCRQCSHEDCTSARHLTTYCKILYMGCMAHFILSF